MKKLILILLFLLPPTMLWAQNPSTWYTQDKGQTTLNVKLFLSTTCKYCQKADAFFKKIEVSYPWIQVSRHFINTDKESLILFNQLLAEQNMEDFRVPSTFFCKTRWVGFDAENTTGLSLLKALEHCKQGIKQSGFLTQAMVDNLRHQSVATNFEMKINQSQSQYKVLFISLLDAFNPCSFFGVLGFLALLFMQTKTKSQVLTGLLFIVTFGIIHYIQQNYSLIYFELIPWLRVPAVLIGLYLLYLARLQWRHLQSTTHFTLKPGRFYIGAVLIAIMIGFYQQSCLRNWAYLFGQWVEHQNYSSTQIAWYAVGYEFLYLIPALLLLLLYTFFINLKLWPRLKKRLHKIGMLFLVLLGSLLIIYPQGLSSYAFSLITLILLGLGSWIL